MKLILFIDKIARFVDFLLPLPEAYLYFRLRISGTLREMTEMNKEEKKQFILENLIYVIIWLVVFTTPLFTANYPQSNERDWLLILMLWKTTLPFFFLFLLNNYVLVPFFLIRRKSWKYALFVFLSLLVLSVFRPQRPFMSAEPRMGGGGGRLPFPQEERFRPPRERPWGDAFGPQARRSPAAPPFHFLRWMINPWMIAILLLGFNIAIKFLFKSIRDDRHLRELEKYTLEVELNYLKAQINPHFFMNTLNNIHALIDINTEKAKETVIELSKIMRYVLYEANQTQVLLTKEIQFIENYIALMRIRYTDGIDIRLQLPESIPPDATISPLLLVTIIENAFKHGISYRHNSFVHVVLSIADNRLSCLVMNRIPPSFTPRHPGMGMENIRKRLSLLFDNNYTLDTQQNDEEYRVTLIVPLLRDALHSDRR
ncbi:MAG: histidine kinase [Tannerellaceae bacterium]|nr:histidine kinase [Tannerellaceae bacterium]